MWRSIAAGGTADAKKAVLERNRLLVDAQERARAWIEAFDGKKR
jgi:hypothetical protein